MNGETWRPDKVPIAFALGYTRLQRCPSLTKGYGLGVRLYTTCLTLRPPHYRYRLFCASR